MRILRQQMYEFKGLKTISRVSTCRFRFSRAKYKGLKTFIGGSMKQYKRTMTKRSQMITTKTRLIF